jgi:uncharacterized protein (TIGR02246 family)
MTASDDLRPLAEKWAIQELMANYAERIDAKDPAGAAACFTEDGVGAYWGECRGRAAIEARLSGILEAFLATSHHLSNIQIRLDGERATALSYVYAFHRLADSRAPMHYWGRWADELVKRDGRWLFARREVIGVGSIGSARGDFDHPGHPGRF